MQRRAAEWERQIEHLDAKANASKTIKNPQFSWVFDGFPPVFEAFRPFFHGFFHVFPWFLGGFSMAFAV